jgi:NADH:ubiquinone oxidoreductase subunit E
MLLKWNRRFDGLHFEKIRQKSRNDSRWTFEVKGVECLGACGYAP